ncbi:MAG: AAA family ATPase, partial [Bosea sp. (in: a-proteobacteria)]
MSDSRTVSLPSSIDATLSLLQGQGYVADRALATVLFLALRMKRPLLLEGEAGTGKTEIAKVLSAALGRKLIRLQCYEGLDLASAVYEWNYAGQMMAIRLAEAGGGAGDRLGRRRGDAGRAGRDLDMFLRVGGEGHRLSPSRTAGAAGERRCRRGPPPRSAAATCRGQG